MRISEENVEAFHARLENRADLVPVTLSLNNRGHDIWLPAQEDLGDEDKLYLLQRASTLRWVEGPGELSVSNHKVAAQLLADETSRGGVLEFEVNLFSSLVISPSSGELTAGDGVCNLFLDVGGSSLKAVLFSNRQLARQLSMAWEPFRYSEMKQLINKLKEFLREICGERLPASVSHVGISCAGLCRDGALLASTLTQGMTFSGSKPYDPWFLRKMIQRSFPESSFTLLNDGAVTALPHREQAPFGKRCVLSLVMGSNLGGGYYSEELTHAVHELGFIPFLLGCKLKDKWSGYEGIASEVFSKKGLLWIASQHGYILAGGVSERDLIDQLHTDLRHGLAKARIVFQKLGKYLGPFVVYLQRFYQIDEVLLSGGILTASVVDEMRDSYHLSYSELSASPTPSLRMLVVPGVLPEYNQAWSLALNHFAMNS